MAAPSFGGPGGMGDPFSFGGGGGAHSRPAAASRAAAGAPPAFGGAPSHPSAVSSGPAFWDPGAAGGAAFGGGGGAGSGGVGPAVGSMGSMGSMMMGGPGGSGGVGGMAAAGGDDDDFSNEPPLLVELGVDFVHIRAKVGGVLNITKSIDPALMADADMAGPLMFALVLGFALLMVGKLHFGYIYGFGAFGCLAIYLLVSLMADPASAIDVSRTVSILGYCLLPIVALAAVAVFVDLRGVTGAALGTAAVLWCTQSATRFFEGALQMRAQRYLIAYPTLLLYACFALITIF